MNKMQKVESADVVKNLGLPDFELSVDQKKNVSAEAFAQAVRVLLQNWRQGTVACKDRGDLVSRSNKKPWKQKGTGRARAGSARSPLWRGGGVTFGPQPRTRSLKVAKNVKQAILSKLFFDFAEKKRIFSISGGVTGDEPSTAQLFRYLRAANLHDCNVVLFISPVDKLTYLSCVNIPTVRVLFFDQANAYDLSRAGAWVFFDKDITRFKDMVQQWI